MVVNKGYFKHFISIFLEIFLFSDLAGWEDDTGEPAEEPPAGEAGDGGEGGRGEAHHHVGQGHVGHKQIDPWQHSSTLKIREVLQRKYSRQCA